MMIVINLHVFRCCCPFVARETQKKKKSCRGHLIAEFDTEAGVVSLFFLHGYGAPQKKAEKETDYNYAPLFLVGSAPLPL